MRLTDDAAFALCLCIDGVLSCYSILHKRTTPLSQIILLNTQL